MEKSDHRHRRLLRARRDRLAGRRAAEQPDELAASQSELHAILTVPEAAYPMGAGASAEIGGLGQGQAATCHLVAGRKMKAEADRAVVGAVEI